MISSFMISRPLRRLVLAITAVLLAITGLTVPGPSAEAAARAPIMVSIANVGSVSQPAVGRILRDVKPQVMVVSEAYNAGPHLTRLGRQYHYRVIQFHRGYGAEAPDVAMLVRTDVAITSTALMKMTVGWSYNGKQRAPRRYPVVVVQHLGRTWDVIGVHLPPGGPGGGNRRAWLESANRVEGYAAAHTAHPVVAAGDFNAVADSCAAHFSGFTVRKGAKVDHAAVRKSRGTTIDTVRTHQVRNANSHGWLTFGLSDG
ncbi:endonuclease/exonuclease/phosphatase family protein [Microlunatus soli]|uniref:Endonuclease/Exonuclease/phosphatase family protein n=1 Tax=Microlunatus soli TaxID=630515 RepID=A0A1H1S3R8_9ACTN|nr:endonuclease/exonuclease/phosphatase family protein [Microlunatus soli]SDS42647.1 Endonuclease/Exonuclease/phosphatase family protein [Microlunatus soli]